MNKLLIISKNADEYARLLEEQGLPELVFSTCLGPDCDESLIRDADIILGEPALVAQVLDQAQGLEWVQSTFAGIEPLCRPGLKTDYTLTGVKEVFGPLMSEYVFAYALALERNIFATRMNQKQNLWEEIPYRGLTGLTVGICGLGSIGRHIATTAAHFNMKVLGLSRTATETPFVDQVYDLSGINTFMGRLDYLVVVLPNTPATKGFINSDVLKHIKPSTVLFNVGRGACVDETAVATALEEGRLRAAVLDVFNTEPLPENSPLWQLENAYLTPHNSALSFPKDIVDIFCENYRRYNSGARLQFVIDLEQGY